VGEAIAAIAAIAVTGATAVTGADAVTGAPAHAASWFANPAGGSEPAAGFVWESSHSHRC
jgi:hypothetical protein